ncbi:MAG: hypothetical protein ABSE07_02260 [Methanoregula sp.]|jgi:hypothetical protein
MSQITIDTDKLKHWVIIVFAIIGAGCVAGIAGYTVFHLLVSAPAPEQPSATPANTPTPTATPAPYPATLTYEVLSSTMSTGHYQVNTVEGQALYFPDFTVWNNQQPGNIYSVNIVGTDNGAYLVGSSIQLLSEGVDGYPTYYYYGNRYNYPYYGQYWIHDNTVTYWLWLGQYYQCDSVSCDPISWKQAAGEEINEGYPPHQARN